MTPVVLVHGLFGSLSAPKILAPFDTYPVFAPDMLGYGSFKETPVDSLRLLDQAEHLAAWIADNIGGPVHIVGHSVGGAISVLFASAYPDMVSSITSVEGNFTLDDAFWSGQIAKKSVADVQQIINEYNDNVSSWLSKSGVNPTEEDLGIAAAWLANQPASTIIAQAKAVVAATADPSYLQAVRAVIDTEMPFHLLSGSNSRNGWNVPAWVVGRAKTDRLIDSTGHLMMLQQPAQFAAVILENISEITVSA